MLNRATIVIVATLLLCVSSVAQERVTDYRYMVDRIDGVYIPKDMDDAIECIDTLLSEEDKQYVADSLSLDAFCASTHFTLGLWMRNNWGLWGGSRLKRYFTERNVYHPDDMSGEILTAYYKKKIEGTEYVLEEDSAQNAQPTATVKVIKTKLGWFWYKLRNKWSRGMREAKRELREDGFRKGKTVSFLYPYGCSTEEEQKIWLSADDSTLVPKGKILDIDYYGRQIKVELISTISPYGIIVFDGNIKADSEQKIERDFKNFSVNHPNRFYMQKGEVRWFGLNSHWQPIKKKRHEKDA